MRDYLTPVSLKCICLSQQVCKLTNSETKGHKREGRKLKNYVLEKFFYFNQCLFLTTEIKIPDICQTRIGGKKRSFTQIP